MKGKRIAFAGESQCGKSTLGKYLMSITRQEVYAISIKNNLGRPIYMNWKVFMQDIKGKKDIFIFIDEAKSFINKNEDFMERYKGDFLQLLRMAKEWNIIVIMVFHSLREIPVWLLAHLDEIERWETKEDKVRQARRFADFEYVHDSLVTRPNLDKYEHVSLKIES
jgi:GTP-binding protein EngB required for normal cell division